jgi:hypothetical protein
MIIFFTIIKAFNGCFDIIQRNALKSRPFFPCYYNIAFDAKIYSLDNITPKAYCSKHETSIS